MVRKSTSTHACIYLSQVELTIPVRFDIFIADEITDPTCRDEVMAHEKQHVQIYREEILSKKNELKDHLVKVFSAKNGWGVPAGRDIQTEIYKQRDKIREEISAEIDRKFKEYRAAAEPRHVAEVDTPASSERAGECLLKYFGIEKPKDAASGKEQ